MPSELSWALHGRATSIGVVARPFLEHGNLVAPFTVKESNMSDLPERVIGRPRRSTSGGRCRPVSRWA